MVWFICATTIHSSPSWNTVLVVVTSTACYIGYHLLCSTNKWMEVNLIIRVALIGWIMDTILQANQFVFFESSYPTPLSKMQPFWMTCLWIGLGATINSSLNWLKNIEPLYRALIGLCSGAASYAGGERFGALHFASTYSLLVVAICWALVLPILVLIGQDNLHQK
jgi:Protein of unknown function (DUF2878)